MGIEFLDKNHSGPKILFYLQLETFLLFELTVNKKTFCVDLILSRQKNFLDVDMAFYLTPIDIFLSDSRPFFSPQSRTKNPAASLKRHSKSSATGTPLSHQLTPSKTLKKTNAKKKKKKKSAPPSNAAKKNSKGKKKKNKPKKN